MLIAIGLWAELEKYNPESQVSQISKFYLNPAWILILIGLLTFILGFSGKYLEIYANYRHFFF